MTTDKNISRRDFLKITCGIMAGLATLPLKKLFTLNEKSKKQKNSDHHTREAKYYSQSNLAG